jgi:predicted membrane channel-forming protein YqfA (hemolysin III family)
MYLGFISGFALMVFLFSLTPKFNKPEKRKLRGWLFLLLGVSTGVPIIHLALFL